MMRTLILLCLNVFVAAPALYAQPAQLPNQEETRRCAFIGQWGSFHLIESIGTAAYTLGKDQYIADLTFAREDRSFWYYSPANGDATTTLWAFARQRDNCGRYPVWRLSQGTWKRYETTKAWGIGLGGSAASIGNPDQIADLQNEVRILKQRVDRLEQRRP